MPKIITPIMPTATATHHARRTSRTASSASIVPIPASISRAQESGFARRGILETGRRSHRRRAAPTPVSPCPSAGEHREKPRDIHEQRASFADGLLQQVRSRGMGELHRALIYDAEGRDRKCQEPRIRLLLQHHPAHQRRTKQARLPRLTLARCKHLNDIGR